MSRITCGNIFATDLEIPGFENMVVGTANQIDGLQVVQDRRTDYPKKQTTTAAVILNREDLVRGTNAVCFLSNRTFDNAIASGINSALIGGFNNQVASQDSIIIGGNANSIIGGSSSSAVVGGFDNLIDNSSVYATTIGGEKNSISFGLRCSVIGANDSTITGTSTFNPVAGSVICGGFINQIIGDSDESIIGAGNNNIINESKYSFVAGSTNKIVKSSNSTICGGVLNEIGDITQITDIINTSVIGGGNENKVYARFAGIFTGDKNKVELDSKGSCILTGESNIIGGSSINAVINCGFTNLLINSYSSNIAGGDVQSLSNSDMSFIGGGLNNAISDSTHCIIGSGQDNTIQNTSTHSTILCGTSNIVNQSQHSAVVGGTINTITNANRSIIATGINNIVGDAANAVISNSFIGSGNNNKVYSNNSSIVSGQVNEIELGSNQCMIGAGAENTISGNSISSGIMGGFQCGIVASNSSSIVNGDQNNINNSPISFISGGRVNNITDSNKCFILGGQEHTIQSGCLYSQILGGIDNTITGVNNSTAIGNRCNITHERNIMLCATSQVGPYNSKREDEIHMKVPSRGTVRFNNLVTLPFTLNIPPLLNSADPATATVKFHDIDLTLSYDLNFTIDIYTRLLEADNTFFRHSHSTISVSVSRDDVSGTVTMNQNKITRGETTGRIELLNFDLTLDVLSLQWNFNESSVLMADNSQYSMCEIRAHTDHPDPFSSLAVSSSNTSAVLTW